MGMKNRYTVYPVAEMIMVESEGVTAVELYSIPDGMVVNLVLAVVKAPCTDEDANTLIVGDEDDDNGYIVAADAKAAALTVYGGDPTQRGAYLYDATKKGSFAKVYSAPKTLKFKLSAAPDAEGEYYIYIFGHRAIQL